MCVARRRKRALLQLSQFTPVQYPKGLRYRGVGWYENPGEHVLMCSPAPLVERCLTDLTKNCPPPAVPLPASLGTMSHTKLPWPCLFSVMLQLLYTTHAMRRKKSCMCCSRFFSVDFWSNFYLQNTWVRLAQVFLGPLCVEMGFYTDISWESRCYIEINIWAQFYKILLLFEVPYWPGVKAMPGKS